MGLEQKDIDSFEAIKEFVVCLNGVFGKRNQKLALYNRLVETTTVEQEDRVRLIVSAFKDFCQENSLMIINKNLDTLQKGTKICYDNKPNISIEIKHFLSNSTPEIKRTINDHLLTITALLGNEQTLQNIDEQLKKELEVKPSIQIDNSTSEGKFISEILDKTQNAFGGNEPTDPMSAMMTMMASGTLKEITEDITQKISSGEVDITKLMGMMQGMISDLQNSGVQMPNMQEIAKMVQAPPNLKIDSQK